MCFVFQTLYRLFQPLPSHDKVLALVDGGADQLLYVASNVHELNRKPRPLKQWHIQLGFALLDEASRFLLLHSKSTNRVSDHIGRVRFRIFSVTTASSDDPAVSSSLRLTFTSSTIRGQAWKRQATISTWRMRRRACPLTPWLTFCLFRREIKSFSLMW